MVRYTIAGKNKPIEKHFSHILLGEIPLMVHSDGCILHQQGPKVLQAFNECPYDQGGYFIINGKEKVVISQERMVTNRLFLEKSKDPKFSHKGWVRCTTETGEAALLPKTIEVYILHPDANIQTLKEDDADDEEEKPIKRTERIKYRGAILVSLPNIRDPNKKLFKIPLFQLFRAFGIESDKEILETIFGDVSKLPQEYIDFIMPSIRHCSDKDINIFSQNDAIESLKNYVRFKSNEHVHSILTQDIFPNMGEDYAMKARFLGYLIKYMMEMVLKVRPVADRDGYGFKRIDLSGFLLSQLFHNIYKRFKKHCRDLLDQEYHYGPTKNTGHYEDMVRKENIQKIISPYFITERMVRSLKGLWGSSDQDEKQEKVQDLSRISYIGFISNLRRVNTPLDRSIKITSPHRLNAQQWGIICPFESPDGASIGYLKNFALLAHVSFGTNPEDLLTEPFNCLRELELIPLHLLTPASANTITKVFLNGKWIGCHNKPDIFTYRLRLLRRNGLINAFISVAWKINMNEIRIQTDPGRACRPLLIAHRDGMVINDKISWFDLLFGTLLPKGEKIEELYYKSSYKSPSTIKELTGLSMDDTFKQLEKTQGYIEFLDIEEEDTRLIAMKKEDVNVFNTHIEIHPSTILSVVSTNIPLANHNQGPRNIFYGAQSKQAIGIYATNFSKRFDTMSYIMHYPEKPIITTQNSHYISNDKLPSGFNTIVAVMTNTGYNQEDGIIVNKTSIDRGLFQITGYKSYHAEESAVNNHQYTMFVNPLKLKKDKQIEIDNLKDESNYQLLDERGIATEESFVTKGSKLSIIGMVEVKEQLKEVRKGLKIETQVVKTYRNASVITGVHHYGTIDKVYMDSKGSINEHNRICKIRFRKIRRPELGDKLCSRHGQKGVCGMLLPEEDMPFTKDGIVPDIIINPHAIPSRMTIGHLVECIFAKLCTLEGMTGDGSVFIPFDIEKTAEQLEKNHNLQKYGNEILYNGRTGEQIASEIFMGPTYYLRLKHMVADKIHCRDKGPLDQLTRQPTSGRGKEGGLRIGEMERDVLLSYGFSQFAKESVMERSDKFTWAVCKSCGRIARYAPNQGLYECLGCDGMDIAVVQTPYAFKLLTQELETMGITPRFVMDTPEDLSEEEDIIEDSNYFETIESEQEGGQINENSESLDDTITDNDNEDSDAYDSDIDNEKQLGGELNDDINSISIEYSAKNIDDEEHNEDDDNEAVDNEEDDEDKEDEDITGDEEDDEDKEDEDITGDVEEKLAGENINLLKTDFSDDDISNESIEIEENTKKVVFINDNHWNKMDKNVNDEMEGDE